MYTLDTNAIIYYLGNDPDVTPVISGVVARGVPLYVSSITELELFGFPDLGVEEAMAIDVILKTLAVIAVDSNIARIAGAIRKNYRLNIADSVIAATALFTGTTLLTRNIKDFRKVPDLLLQKI